MCEEKGKGNGKDRMAGRGGGVAWWVIVFVLERIGLACARAPRRGEERRRRVGRSDGGEDACSSIRSLFSVLCSRVLRARHDRMSVVGARGETVGRRGGGTPDLCFRTRTRTRTRGSGPTRHVPLAFPFPFPPNASQIQFREHPLFSSDGAGAAMGSGAGAGTGTGTGTGEGAATGTGTGSAFASRFLMQLRVQPVVVA